MVDSYLSSKSCVNSPNGFREETYRDNRRQTDAGAKAMALLTQSSRTRNGSWVPVYVGIYVGFEF